MSKKKCKVEVFSRVTGFFRPMQTWNEGKVEEFKDRKKYSIDNMTGKQNDLCGVAENIAS